jgi:hypothetical protein
MLKSVGGKMLDVNQMFVIYPNPAKDILNVTVSEPGDLMLYDLKGCLVREWNITEKGIHKLLLDEIPSGQMFVHYRTVSGLKYNGLPIFIQ